MRLTLITHNLGMKIVALIVALSLWTFVAASISNVAKFPGSIPVKVVNTNQNLVAIYDVKEVSVKISADAKVWQQLSSDNFSAFVDLNGLSAGTHNLKVIVSSSLPSIQIVEVSPQNIMVRLEPVVKKEVPVTAVFSGQVAEGRTVGAVDFTPEKVEISGAKSIVDAIGTASAEIALSGENDDFERNIPLKILNEKAEIIPDVSISPAESKVSVRVVKAGNNKTVGVKVVTTGFPESGFYVSSLVADPAVVDIIGQDSTLRTVQFVETAPIDISGLRETTTKSVSLNLPAGITLQQDASTRIKVTLNFSASLTTKEVVATINVVNLTAGLRVDSYDPTTIKVIVSGPTDVLNSLVTNDIILDLNLSGRTAGTAGIELTKEMFRLSKDVSIVSFLPSSISVTLSTN